MTIIIDLLRHGKVDGPAALYGRTDIDVTDTGFAAMLSQSQSLGEIKQVFTSPLCRCRKLAESLDEQAKVINGLAELDFGDFDGVPFDSVNNDWSKFESFWSDPLSNTPPGGESLQDFQKRVLVGWAEVVEQSVAGHNLVVCHGGVIRVILAHVLQVAELNGRWFTSLTIGYAGLTRIEMSGHHNENGIVRYINKEPN